MERGRLRTREARGVNVKKVPRKSIYQNIFYISLNFGAVSFTTAHDTRAIRLKGKIFYEKNIMSTNNIENPFLIWELPEVLVYHIACFVAPQTKRATILCHKIAPLCKASSKAILEETRSVALWDLVLKGDYDVQNPMETTTRRSCKRLRRSPVDKVRDAHKVILDQTEIAYFYLWELSYESTKNSLTKSKLYSILEEYGPRLFLNQTVSNGGTFLVEVCRSRNTAQATILHCVQELVENRGALVNLATNESSNSILTPLCVAAVRGMPKVVKYLLSKGASPYIKSNARFRLYKNPKKSLKSQDSTPLQFAMSMLDAERKEGAKPHELVNLNKCITLLAAVME